MTEPRVMVLRAAGTNCDAETAFAFEHAGARASVVHINRLLQSPRLLDEVGLVAIAGGFSYGDDIAAGKVMAIEIAHSLGEAFRRFVSRGGLVLGICNGFQVLVRTGLITAKGTGTTAEPITLHWNDSHRYEDRWVHLQVDPTLCVLAPRDRSHLSLPVAHGEGKFMAQQASTIDRLIANHQAVLRYVEEDGSEPRYPANPNGSMGHIAGVCDPTGQVFGLMPHPERALFPWHHPSWTREPDRKVGDGDCLFRAAVAAMR